LRHRAFICDRQIDSRLAAGGRDGAQPGERTAGQFYGGAAGRQVDDSHVAPEHAGAHAGAERFGAGLLGREALGIGLDAPGASFRLGPLGSGENAIEKALAVSFDGAFDAADIDEVGTDTENHVRVFRPRSMTARMVFTASARPENTASPIRKWPILSSTISGNAAIASAVSKLSPCPACTSRPRRRASCAPWRMRSHSACAADIRPSASASH